MIIYNRGITNYDTAIILYSIINHIQKSIILINYLSSLPNIVLFCSYYPNAINNKSKYRYNIIIYSSIIYILN